MTKPDPVPRTRAVSDLRRHLRRCDNDEVFAYATHDHDFVCARDHTLWAHERDDLLRCARSGNPLVRRSAVVFYDVESNQPLYYEAHGRDRARAQGHSPNFRGSLSPSGGSRQE